MAARALAPAPARAPEPGSTNRAQTARQAAKTGAPRGGAAISARGASSGLVNVSSSLFEPSPAVAEEIEKAGPRGLDVRVIVKGLTEEGLIKVRQDRGKKFDSIGLGTMPLLNPWTQELGGMYLNFAIDNSAIKNGYASFKPRGGDRNDWLQALKKNSALLGGLGLKIESLPTPVNKFEQGKLVLGVAGIKVVVGGYVDAAFDLLLENMEAPKINGSADIDVRGAAKGQLAFDNPGNVLRGSVSLAVNFKSFSGAVKVAYRSDGTVDISGSAAYNANKLSGEIQFVATDLDTANKFAKDAIAAAGGKENVQNAGPPSPVPVAKEGKKERGLAATGRLSFNLTTWFAGTVQVVVDGKGAVTVIGKIAPPGEIILFAERPWNKEIVKFEAKAYYGIPVVGNLNLFANISLIAIAKLGPARLYAIEILGTYSTDPEIQKNIEISGSINISAYGGLRLRAEGGAGIEILGHDLKFGIGLNADVGVKAYADARPTIGYRDPGVFYVSGTLDLVAQPMLGLGGEFFIELDAPWYSPLSDDRWSWPLFSKEWPLGDPIGMSATVKDYVLGSGKVPEIELKPPEFDPSKFMTTMVDDKLPNKTGGTGAGRGTFKEDGTVPKPVVKPKLPPKSAPPNLSKKGGKPGLGKSARPDSKAANDAKSTAILQKAAKPLTDLKGRGPLTRGSLDQELGKIRKQVSGVDFGVRSNGAKWLVSPKAGRMAGKGLEIGAKSEAAKVPINVTKLSSAANLSDGEGHTVYGAVSNGKVALTMASGTEAQMDFVLTRLREICKRAMSEYSAALNANPARKAKIQETYQYLAHIINITRPQWEGEHSIYVAIRAISEGRETRYANMSAAAREAAAKEELRLYVAGISGNLAKSVKLGFGSLSEVKFNSGYVDAGGTLKAQFQNVRASFYSIGWTSVANSAAATQMATLRTKALTLKPALASLPNPSRFYWSEDKSGASSVAGYIADSTDAANNGQPEKDHITPLGTRWESGTKPVGTPPGNNIAHPARVTDYQLDIQVISKKTNLAKSGPRFVHNVGPNFRGPLDV